MKTFADRVRDVVREIPKGKVLTYGEVARKAGKNPGEKLAARAVGAVMSKNYDSTVPCHRVIRADGKMGGYNRGGGEKKKMILRREGVIL